MKKYYHTTLRLWGLLKPFHKHFYIQLFFIILSQIIFIGITFIFAKILNSIVSKDVILAIQFLSIWLSLNIFEAILVNISANHNIKYLDHSVQQFLEEYSFKNVFNLNASQYVENHSAVSY